MLIENFRPGTLEGWGLATRRCPSDNPGLIMLRISRLRPDRPVPRPAGLRLDRRGDGRPAPPHRRAGPRAGALRHLDRRHARRAARHDRRADRAVPPQGQRRQGPGHRRRAARGGVQRDGEPGARVQRLRRRSASPPGSALPGIAPTQRLPLQRRRRGPDRRQRRQHLQAPDGRRSAATTWRDDPALADNDGRVKRVRRARRRDRGLDPAAHVDRGAWPCSARPGCRPGASTPPRTSSKTRTTGRAR